MTNNFYSVLGVSEDAGIDELRLAFRRLARRHHPDINPEDPEAADRFRSVTDAYRALLDPAERQRHDREVLGRRRDDHAEPGRANVFQEAGRRQAAPGRDVVAVLDLDLPRVAGGGTFDVDVTGPVRCGDCHGEGFDVAGRIVTCWTCHGTGTMTYENRLGTASGVCLTCAGEKTQHIDGCPACGGDGTVTTTRTVRVTIPAGLDDGDTLTAEGEGGPGGTGGPPGDLLVVIRVAPHPVFRRDGLDLEVDVPITYLEAVFGVDVEIPSLGGPLTLRLPPGTQGGSAHRLDGRGIAAAGGTGDLVAIAHIAVPTDPDAAERSALAALTPFEPEDLRRDLF